MRAVTILLVAVLATVVHGVTATSAIGDISVFKMIESYPLLDKLAKDAGNRGAKEGLALKWKHLGLTGTDTHKALSELVWKKCGPSAAATLVSGYVAPIFLAPAALGYSLNNNIEMYTAEVAINVFSLRNANNSDTKKEMDNLLKVDLQIQALALVLAYAGGPLGSVLGSLVDFGVCAFQASAWMSTITAD